MIVYVESNFALELALQQEQAKFAEETNVKDKLLSKTLIKSELGRYQCQYIHTFEDGLSFVMAKV